MFMTRLTHAYCDAVVATDCGMRHADSVFVAFYCGEKFSDSGLCSCRLRREQ